MFALAGLIRVLYPRRWWPWGRFPDCGSPTDIDACGTLKSQTPPLAVQGMTHLALCRIQSQPDAREPRPQQLLTMLENRAVLMQTTQSSA